MLWPVPTIFIQRLSRSGTRAGGWFYGSSARSSHGIRSVSSATGGHSQDGSRHENYGIDSAAGCRTGAFPNSRPH